MRQKKVEGRDAHVVTHHRDVARLTKDVIRTINGKVGPKRSLVNEQGGDELPGGKVTFQEVVEANWPS